jgi:hypothetical protein
VALGQLARLRAGMNPDRYLEFIVEVSLVLRTYIQAITDLRALHRSTEEFLAEAAGDPALSQDQQLRLGEFLKQCDLVKFARRHAAPARMLALLEAAEGFVHETVPKEGTATAEAGV